MSRRGVALWSLLGLVVVAVTLSVTARRAAGPSALSAGSRGWLAARHYLEVRGTGVELAARPLAAPSEAVWVLAFPWQRGLDDGELDALTAHLRAGGTVLYAYSSRLGRHEEDVAEILGLTPRQLAGRPPISPWRWWRRERATWRLQPVDGGWTAPLSVPVHRRVPRAPDGARAFFEDDDGVPFVYVLRRHGGRVVVLPAALFANSRVLDPAHADLLESLRRELGEAWRFAEYHHGLVAPDLAAAAAATSFAWDLFMVHLALFYVLGCLAVARRFGPAWREPPIQVGSTAAFLRQLGALHRELGHQPEAARLLVERVRQLEPDLPDIAVPSTLDDAGLVELAGEVARARRRRGPHGWSHPRLQPAAPRV